MGTTVAFDQSTSHVGWARMVNGVFETGGVFIPRTKPDYDDLRSFVRSVVSPGDTVIVETVYFGLNAKVHEELIRVQSHIWAASREQGCDVIPVTPLAAMKALTGVTNPRTKSKERKALMVKAASALLGEPVSEHLADAVGLAWAYLRLSPVLDPELAVGLF